MEDNLLTVESPIDTELPPVDTELPVDNGSSSNILFFIMLITAILVLISILVYFIYYSDTSDIVKEKYNTALTRDLNKDKQCIIEKTQNLKSSLQDNIDKGKSKYETTLNRSFDKDKETISTHLNTGKDKVVDKLRNVMPNNSKFTGALIPNKQGPNDKPRCRRGEDCGGQVWNSCGTSCPDICGKPRPEACIENCVRGYQCPIGQCFDETAGVCGREIVNEPRCRLGEDCGGQEFQYCGDSCPSICGKPRPDKCIKMCQRGYQCPIGQCFDETAGVCGREIVNENLRKKVQEEVQEEEEVEEEEEEVQEEEVQDVQEEEEVEEEVKEVQEEVKKDYYMDLLFDFG